MQLVKATVLRHMSRCLVVFWLSSTLLAFNPVAANTVSKPNADYSPFVLRISGHTTFSTISFKNVTTGKSASQVDFELMAESLAMALRQSHPHILVEVVYAPEFLNPTNHLFCAERHLYVDFWGLQTGQVWGYSLWSGCGEDDRFAWRQFDGHFRTIALQIERITLDMGRSLKRADERACYQRAC